MMCAEAGDFSPLMPMSVKDVIWVSVAQGVIRQAKNKVTESLVEMSFNAAKRLMLMLDDIRTLIYDTDFYARLAATKDAKTKPFNQRKLPSVVFEENREAEEFNERMKNLTQEERDRETAKRLNEGKKIIMR